MTILTKKEILENRRIFSETDKIMAATFKTFSDVNRYRIFRILAEQPELAVSSIAEILDISLPLASQHIKILAHANLLKKERTGKKVLTKLEHNNPFVKAMVKIIKQALRLTNQ